MSGNTICNKQRKILTLKLVGYSRVLLRRQLMKRQMFVRKLMFLVCCSFLVIWSINVLNTKCKLNCQNEFFGKPFLKSGNTGVYFMF